MLFRKSSNVSTRLRRSKSAASVRTHHVSPSKSDCVAPETPHQHALVAASLAFERTGQSGGNRPLTRQHSSLSSHTGSRHGLSRRQSVRFAGPTAVPRRRLTRSYDSGAVGSNRIASPASTSNLKSAQQYGPDGLPSGLAALESATVLLDERVTPQDDIASAPSSYRRIRKAKSMVDPRKPLPHRNIRASRASYPTTYASSAGPSLRNQGLKTSRSLSFLRTSRNRAPRHQENTNTSAVQLAREIYSQGAEPQNQDGRPSFVSTASSRRWQGGFRKTVRTSIDTNNDATIRPGTPHLGLPKNFFSAKARNFSVSIKKKFKRVFHRSSDAVEELPIQHLEASRHYYGLDTEASATPEGRENFLSGDVQTISRVTSRVPSFRIVSSGMEEPRSRTGSIHSTQSPSEFGNDKSRVTSWTNSTAANTLATSHMTAAKRLSIIQENGNPYRAPLFKTRTKNRYSAFRGPMEGGLPSSYGSEAVDSHRVYSALLKRLEGSGANGRTVMSGPHCEGNHNSMRRGSSSIPLRTSSMDSSQRDPTIKHDVNENCQLFQQPAENGAVTDSTNKGIISPEDSPTLPPAQIVSGTSTAGRSERCGNLRQHEGDPDSENNTSGAMGLEKINRSSLLSSSIEPDVVGARIALGAMVRHDQETPSGESVLEKDRSEERHELRRQGSPLSSGSMYSRSTGGNTHKPPETTFDAVNLENNRLSDLNDYLSSSGYHARDTTPTSKRSTVSVESSEEWKARMAFNVSSQNLPPIEDSQRLSPTYRRSRGHCRENAAIVEDDVFTGSDRPHQKSPAAPHAYSLPRSSTTHVSPLGELDVLSVNIMNFRQRRQCSPASLDAGQVDDSVSKNGVENMHLSSDDTLLHARHEIRPSASKLSLRTMNKSLGSLQDTSSTWAEQIAQKGRQNINAFKLHNIPKARSVANLGMRYSPERARRLAAYQRNKFAQSHTASPDKRDVVLRSSGFNTQNPLTGDRMDLFESSGITSDMVDTYLSNHRHTSGSSTNELGSAFL